MYLTSLLAVSIGEGSPPDFTMLNQGAHEEAMVETGVKPLPSFRESCKAGMAEPGYQSEHCALLRESSLPWPPDYGDFPHIDFSGMNERVAEVVILIGKLFPVLAGPFRLLAVCRCQSQHQEDVLCGR